MAKVGRIKAIKGSQLPSWELWGQSAADGLVDYSSGSFTTVKIRQDGADVVTSGLTATGAAGSGDGSDDDDVPNIVVTRAATTTLDSLDTGRATLVVKHSTGRTHKFVVIVEDEDLP